MLESYREKITSTIASLLPTQPQYGKKCRVEAQHYLLLTDAEDRHGGSSG